MPDRVVAFSGSTAEDATVGRQMEDRAVPVADQHVSVRSLEHRVRAVVEHVQVPEHARLGRQRLQLVPAGEPERQLPSRGCGLGPGHGEVGLDREAERA